MATSGKSGRDDNGRDRDASSISFAPRERRPDPMKRPVRTSLFFITLALSMTIGAVVWLGFFNQTDEIRPDVSNISIDSSSAVELTGAVYRGRSERGNRYEITARVASERSVGVVELREPTARLRRRDGEVMDIRARNGVYFVKDARMELVGGIELTSINLEMTLFAEELRLDLASGVMASDRPVRLQRRNSFIESEGVEVLDRGNQVRFLGRTTLTLDTRRQEK